MTTVLEEIQEERQYKILTKKELLEQKQDLTVDEIMPKWSHLLDLLNTETPDYMTIMLWKQEHNLEMGSYLKCMAAEAHKFSSSYARTTSPYYCKFCDKYADEHFPKLLHRIEDNRDFVGMDWRHNTAIENFVEHWNIVHKEATLLK